MQEKRVESIQEIDFSGLRMPFIAVYKHPDDFPNQCVARVFDLDKPTDTVMVKETVKEIQDDIRENSAMIFMKRGTDDVPALVGVWI